MRSLILPRRRHRWVDAGRRLLAEAADLLLPARCVACDELLLPAGGGAFCDRCAALVVAVDHPCGRCGMPAGSCCTHRRLAFDSARAPLLYGGPVARALLRLKLAGAEHVARQLGPLLAPAARLVPPGGPGEGALIVPVPLHPRRQRQRRFNQSVLIARALGRALGRGGPRLDLATLARVRDTAPQGQLGRRARLVNLDGAFRAARPLEGADVLLIDDVMTTGATASACARALRRAGARRIDVLTVARAVP